MVLAGAKEVDPLTPAFTRRREVFVVSYLEVFSFYTETDCASLQSIFVEVRWQSQGYGSLNQRCGE